MRSSLHSLILYQHNAFQMILLTLKVYFLVFINYLLELGYFSLDINVYHSNIPLLIEKALGYNNNILDILLDECWYTLFFDS